MSEVLTKRISKILTTLIALTASGSVVAATVDSTSLGAGKRKIIASTQSFLLAQGASKIGDGSGYSHANVYTTNKRCPANMAPSLNTSVKSIQRFGEYGILGVENSLYLNTSNYRINGRLDAPAGGFISPNYVVVSWQVWCMSNQA